MEIIGQRVRDLREARGLTQGQLAYKAGTTSSQISRLENDERPGAQAVLIGRIAEVLDTSIDYLLGISDNPIAHNHDDLAGLTAQSKYLLSRIEAMLALLPPERQAIVLGAAEVLANAHRAAAGIEEPEERTERRG